MRYPCERCGGPTYHVCSWVCVDICPKCDRMPLSLHPNQRQSDDGDDDNPFTRAGAITFTIAVLAIVFLFGVYPILLTHY